MTHHPDFKQGLHFEAVFPKCCKKGRESGFWSYKEIRARKANPVLSNLDTSISLTFFRSREVQTMGEKKVPFRSDLIPLFWTGFSCCQVMVYLIPLKSPPLGSLSPLQERRDTWGGGFFHVTLRPSTCCTAPLKGDTRERRLCPFAIKINVTHWLNSLWSYCLLPLRIK